MHGPLNVKLDICHSSLGEESVFSVPFWPNLELKGNVFLYMPWRRLKGEEVYIHTFLSTALDRDEWLELLYVRFTPWW